MGLFDIFKKKNSDDSKYGYYIYDKNSIPRDKGLCSDNNCPCPETVIPRGEGYLYISKEAVTFMKMKMKNKSNNIVFGPMPVLVCEQGAKLRGLDLKVAAADAALWWSEGKAPLRPTPLK